MLFHSLILKFLLSHLTDSKIQLAFLIDIVNIGMVNNVLASLTLALIMIRILILELFDKGLEGICHILKLLLGKIVLLLIKVIVRSSFSIQN